ncbi:Fic family protein [bacterium]|nr:Fic family protein [bacterium]NBX97925.1 Fic family protein [bacterium]NDC94317.1 Fic family protein [bacterium]NDD82783.1 Fic family protein [bacterium]NDG28831.1 Fic family protein [bacterium]
MHIMLTIPEPSFKSSLTDLIVELEGLRNKNVSGTAKPWIFIELKNLFHIVEALSSARIEGNHTTLADFIDAQLSLDLQNEELNEISNIIKCLDFIDKNISTLDINKAFILELHKQVVKGLSTAKEGDSRIGSYRKEPRKIANSQHVLPQPGDIDDLMRELLAFINEKTEPKLDLLKVAIAHHRFVWIHPFGNGNGRVVRLLTYSMLCKQGFITTGLTRLFNPAAVFSGDRQKYYDMLEIADIGTDADILSWSEYVLSGLRDEVKKSQQLTDAKFVRYNILAPTLDWAEEKNILNELEAKVLRRLVKKDSIKAADIRDLWPSDFSHVVVSKFLRKLRKQNFVRPLKENGREYVLKFTGNKLTRGILEQMESQGMLPVHVDELSRSK